MYGTDSARYGQYGQYCTVQMYVVLYIDIVHYEYLTIIVRAVTGRKLSCVTVTVKQ